ncbi:KxYKxGKxW signal peptide domain-containing protein, partial [Liquorilactobacillus aquaticus]|uniref:KxYKxGKxW signal peptide domain-containing protein n=1 Tax=Liquorilactobacillus aquaticus TaxID=392566 RepID=UPI00146FE4E3
MPGSKGNQKRNMYRLLRENEKVHYKMYKDGKQWMFAGMALLGGVLGANIGIRPAHADTVSSTANTSKQLDDKVLANNDSATIPSTSTSTSTVSSTSTNDNQTKLAETSTSMSLALSTSTSNSLSESTSGSVSLSTSNSTVYSTSESTSESNSISNKKSSADSKTEPTKDSQASTDSTAGNTSTSGDSQATNDSVASNNSTSNNSTLSNSTSNNSTSNNSTLSNSTSNNSTSNNSVLNNSTSNNSTSNNSALSNSTLNNITSNNSTSNNSTLNNSALNNSALNSSTSNNSTSSSSGSAATEQSIYNQVAKAVPSDTVIAVDTNAKTISLGATGTSASTPLLEAVSKIGEANGLAVNLVSLDANGNLTSLPVASDPDSGRNDFNNDVTNPSKENTPTSVTVATPDQVTNDATYYATAVANGTEADVSTYDQLRLAWANSNIAYIKVTANIAYASGNTAMSYRANGASVIINGNGHTIDLGTQNLGFLSNSTATTVTLNNATFEQGFAVNDGNGYSLIYSGNGSQLTVNTNNITLTSSASNGNNPIHLMYGVGSKVVFSGKNIFNISNEITRSVGSINIANNSSVTLNRTSNDIGFSEFYFETIAPTGSVGYGNTLTMGDGSSNAAYSYNNRTESFPAMYLFIGGVTAGDNVSWTQTGFQYFINGTQVGYYPNATFAFGQNFKLSAPITTMPGAITVGNNQKVIFNAGTTMDIQQRYNAAILQINGSASVTFISPKSLHLAIQNSTGAAVSTTAGIVAGTGTLTMNNSNIATWTGTNSSTTKPAGDASAKFVNLKYTNGTTTLTDSSGNSASSTILSRTTRELQTLALPVGTINVQYVDQYGNVIKTVPVDLDNDAYIGEYISLINELYANTDMPGYYMWAIGNQVPTSAKTDAQSGGDSTTTADNGDSYGQANIAVVPMQDQTYNYKIYVYGVANNNVTYQYVDAITGKVITVSGDNAGKEAAGTNNVPANYGNTIDWTSSYYTNTNVPTGYHYATGSELNGNVQPTNLKVGTAASNTKIYLVSDSYASESTSASISTSTSSSLSNSASTSSSLSTSGSLSNSASTSASLSTSGSLSDSSSISASLSTSDSLSNSASTSTSLSTSDSLSNSGSISSSLSTSGSLSNSASTSSSLSTSDSLSDSGSTSSSLSTSGSLSNSGSTSASLSTSGSLSNSGSTSASLSTSGSLSNSASTSASLSTSGSLSNSVSTSGSLSTSDSLSDSTSTSSSLSTSGSLSDSTSTSSSLSTSGSLSNSASTSASLSTSDSLSDSGSTSASLSTSGSLSDSGSTSTSLSTSGSLSNSASTSSSLSTSGSLSNSASTSASLSTSGSLSDSSSISASLSTSDSLSNSASTSTSLSTSDSLSNSGSISASLSTSDSLSNSASTSSSLSTSGSLS